MTVNKLEEIINAPSGQLYVVEAGHIYTHEVPSYEHELSAQIGAELCKQLEQKGHKTQKWLFIDNYHPKLKKWPEILDEKKYIDLLTELGFEPEVIVYEADLADSAEKILSILITQNKVKEHKGKLHLKHGWVLLANEKNELSCPLLDASLYLQKAKTASAAITVLNKSYQPQQEKTFKVLEALCQNPAIIPRYYDQEKVPA